MSELVVGSLKGLAANNFVIEVASGSQLVQPGGILQVVSTTKTDTFLTSSTSFVDVTGVSVSITPSSASSKILVTVSGVAGNSSANEVTRLNLVRDSTAIAQSTGAGVVNQTLGLLNSTTNGHSPFSMEFLDSPNTTSAVVYKLQLATATANTAFIGRYNVNDNYRSVTVITVMEVAG